MRILKKWLAIGAGFLCMSGMLAGCSGKNTHDQTFRFPLSAEPRQIDPQVSTDPASVAVVAAVFEGLTRLDENGKAVPAAAIWEVSQDGRTYTFHLKQSYWSTVRDKESEWHKPQQVTADDFVFGMQRAVSPSTNSSLAEKLFGIQNAEQIAQGSMPVSKLGVTALDNQTLQIKLTEPDNEFPEKLTATPFMPCNRRFFEQTAGRYGLETAYLISNGPFYVKNWVHQEYLSLVRSEDYHGDVYPAGVRYVITPYEDVLGSMEGGTLDAHELDPDQIQQAKKNDVRVVEMQDTVESIWLNHQIQFLSSPEIRRALRAGIEWNEVSGQLDARFAKIATGFISEKSRVGTEYYRTGNNALSAKTDVGRAQSELRSGMKALGLSEMPVLTVLCANDEYSTDLARYIVQSWQKNISLFCKLEPLDEGALATRLAVGNYEIAVAPMTASGMTALDTLKTYRREDVKNYTRYQGKTYNQLIDRSLEGTVTREEAEKLERMLWDDCVAIPLSFHTRFFGLPHTVSGVVVRPFGGGAFGAPFDFRFAEKETD